MPYLGGRHTNFQSYWISTPFESCKLSDFQKIGEREFRLLIKHNSMKKESAEETKKEFDTHHI